MEPVVDPPLVTELSYWPPPVLVQSAWIEHAPFAAWLMGALRPRMVVELGTHTGFSFFTLAAAAQRLGLATRLVAVDSWEGDDQAGFYGDDVFRGVRAVLESEFPDSTEMVRGYFMDVVGRFADGSVDLLHIDGRHGYEDVWEDWQAYLPKLSDRSVAIFHDTYEFQDGFEVHRFWDEVSAEWPSFRFEHGHGLGVLVVGSDAPRAVLDFVERANADPSHARSIYAQLGHRYQEQWEQRAQLALLEEERARLNGELARLHDEVMRMRATVSWRLTAPLRVVQGMLRRSNSVN